MTNVCSKEEDIGEDAMGGRKGESEDEINVK